MFLPWVARIDHLVIVKKMIEYPGRVPARLIAKSGSPDSDTLTTDATYEKECFLRDQCF